MGLKLSSSPRARVMPDLYCADVDNFVGELIRSGYKRVLRRLAKQFLSVKRP